MKSLLALFVVCLASPVFGEGPEDVRLYRQYLDSPYGQVHARIGRPLDSVVEKHVPLVMLHYSPGSGRVYQYILPFLARDRLVVAFDTPGYGQSDPPPSQPSLGDYTAALMGAMDQLSDAPQFDVFGMLTGSLIAVDMAVTQEPRIRRVMLTNSPVFNERERQEWLDRMSGLAKERQGDWRGRWLVERLESNLARLEPGVSIDHVTGSFIDNISPGHKWVFGEIAAISYRADLAMPKITQPVGIIIWDSEASSGTGMSAATMRGLEIIPHVTRIDMERESAWPFQDQAESISLAVREYLDSEP